MALLHYRNLSFPDSSGVMRSVLHGLSGVKEILERSQRYLDSDAAILRLGWKAVETNTPGEAPEKPVPVELVELPDRPNEPDSTFRSFLSDDTSAVYEVEPPPSPVAGKPVDVVHRFSEEPKIRVVDRDPETNQLVLERIPKQPWLLIRQNTYAQFCQLRAIQNLQDAPEREHTPLLRLLQRRDHASWPVPAPPPAPPPAWTFLADNARPGTAAQRRFVEIALSTPDFAFLDGPPGSGKTTAICELIHQEVLLGKRVLLCASTHVAVDNVLERLAPRGNDNCGDLIPVRIGDRSNVSEKALPFQIEEFARTERKRLLDFLSRPRQRTDAQEELLGVLRERGTAVERMILDAANLVCGTTLGILQHPDIRDSLKRSRRCLPQFDMLILDEASKTTFQEFLVPALLAKRWVVVGDPRQLSPYVEDDLVAVNLAACLREAPARDACIDVFLARRRNPARRRTSLVLSADPTVATAYLSQSVDGAGVAIATKSDEAGLPLADIAILKPEDVESAIDQLPLDVTTVRSVGPVPAVVARRVEEWRRRLGVEREEVPAWERELGWRLVRLYEQRFGEGASAERLDREIRELLPAGEGAAADGSPNGPTWKMIEQVRRVTLPSVLECLQLGFGRDAALQNESALQSGLPKSVLESRSVLLEYQERMHPEISAFPREVIYSGHALKDSPGVGERRAWTYPGYKHRSVWIDVRGKFVEGANTNREEARVVVAELRKFHEWARKNHRDDREPWEVAILGFYRGQVRAVRDELRRLTRQHTSQRYFALGRLPTPEVRIQLCTVDRFQGHEADLVFLTFGNAHSTTFLESPNRLNVAITRARFQRVIVGNRNGMRNSRGPVLKALAEQVPWDSEFGSVAGGAA